MFRDMTDIFREEVYAMMRSGLSLPAHVLQRVNTMVGTAKSQPVTHPFAEVLAEIDDLMAECQRVLDEEDYELLEINLSEAATGGAMGGLKILALAPEVRALIGAPTAGADVYPDEDMEARMNRRI